MISPKIRLAIVILIIFGFHSQAQSQDLKEKKLKAWISVGGNLPVGQEFSRIYSIGLNSNIYLGFNFHKFNIGPAFNLNYHVKYLNEAAKDQLINTGIGLNANYSLPLENSILYFGLVGYYESLNDKISPRKDFVGDDLKILSGSGVSFGPKVSLEYERFVFQLSYLIRNLDVEFDEDITSPFTSFNELYEVFSVEDKIRMNFSSVSISIGYEL